MAQWTAVTNVNKGNGGQWRIHLETGEIESCGVRPLHVPGAVSRQGPVASGAHVLQASSFPTGFCAENGLPIDNISAYIEPLTLSALPH